MRPWLAYAAAALGATLGVSSPHTTFSCSRGPAFGWHAAFADPPGPGQAGGAQPAAPVAISADVMVLHATNDSTGIDARIGSMPALSKPPFSSYNSYKLLDRKTMPLPRAVAAPLALPTGRELHVVYKEFIPPTKDAKAARYVVAASIQKADGKSFLPLVEVNAKTGEWFWVGGQEYKGGSIFIGIRISP